MLELFQNNQVGSSIPSFNLKEIDYSTLPPPPDTVLLRLVVPTNGADTEFIWKVSQLMEVSFDRNDPFEMSQLSFVVEESFRQMFTDFDRSPAVYMKLLQGSLTDPSVPGLPIQMYFNHIPNIVGPGQWPQFKTLVQHYARELYTNVLIWANMPCYQHMTFTYNDYPRSGGGLGFLLSPGNNHYDIG